MTSPGETEDKTLFHRCLSCIAKPPFAFFGSGLALVATAVVSALLLGLIVSFAAHAFGAVNSFLIPLENSLPASLWGIYALHLTTSVLAATFVVAINHYHRDAPTRDPRRYYRYIDCFLLLFVFVFVPLTAVFLRLEQLIEESSFWMNVASTSVVLLMLVGLLVLMVAAPQRVTRTYD